MDEAHRPDGRVTDSTGCECDNCIGKVVSKAPLYFCRGYQRMFNLVVRHREKARGCYGVEYQCRHLSELVCLATGAASNKNNNKKKII